MRGLRDKVVIVTGGARGIGAALCDRLAEEGARVAIFDLLLSDSAVTRTWQVDITDHRAVADAVADVESAIGPIDVLINNAGLNRPAAFISTQPADWRLMIGEQLYRAAQPCIMRWRL